MATNLRRFRDQVSMSQYSLADIAGVDKNYPSNVETQKCSATLDRIERLARALGVEPFFLLQDNAGKDLPVSREEQLANSKATEPEKET
ncbi:MAG: helix-turn-helix domain-containing protein [Sphingomonadales bacterium]|nr:helix-turn-helix domain-containing protein [Sphingomonadales bacterium]